MTSSSQLSSIVAVGLRLYGFYWAVSAAINVVGVFSMGIHLDLLSSDRALSYFIGPIGFLIVAAVCWFGARPISRWATAAAADEELLTPSPASTAHLYTLGFLVIGLCFFLGHFGGVLNWFFYFAMTKSAEAALLNPSGDDRIYRLTADLIPCIAGAICVVLAPKWGKRLAAAFDRTPEPPQKL